MAESIVESLLGPWKKLEGLFASSASSSVQLVVPELVQLNDMVYEVYKPPHEERPEIEIILFHGLQLKACQKAYITTWMTHDNSEFWPQSWLAQEFPKARILTVSYDSFAKRTTEKGRSDMFLIRENLLSDLTSASARVGEAQCPVVLVGHCIGGLLLKELCLHANMVLSEKRDDIPGMERIHKFFNNLGGMFFYGTPHLGSFLGEKLPDCFNGALMAEIEVLNATSARKNASFSDLKSRRKWLTYGMGETQETFLDVIGERLHMVPEPSSRANMDMYYSVNANHPDLCKPRMKQSSAFSFLQQFLFQIQAEYVLRLGDEADVSGRGYVVDFKGRARKVISVLAEPKAHTIFIVGLSGIGKTTLAQQVFHDISHNFAIRCFIPLDNFKTSAKCMEEVLGKIEIDLKRQGKGSHYDHFNVPRYLKGQKVLIVLDNVQSQSQLDALSREIWLEGSNSRLVVTTTDSRLASSPNIFTMKYLTESESRALFNHYAFAKGPVPDELTYLIEQVIKKCGNFPLSLKILGIYLSAEDVNDQNLWEGVIMRLENAEEVASGPDYRLWARLRPCYDALQPSEQEIFLDAAVVFFNWPLSFVEYVWSACRSSPTVAWTNLRRAFLVNEDVHGRIWMHQLLRNLGRSIACPQSSSVERWRRICSGSLERDFIATHQGVVESRSLEIQVHNNERLTLRNTALAQYVMLQYLILDGVEMMTEGSVELPRSLVYLKWKGASFETCPVDFNGLPSFAVLDLQYCKAMRVLPPSVVTRKKMKWLELEGCQSLTKLPEGLYELSDLEYLGLSMTGVKNISRKIEQLKKLRCFRADQTRLARVPHSIGRLGKLKTLNISGTSVTVLPEAIGDLKQLRTLNAENTLLSVVPESIGCLQNLEELYLNNTGVTTLPESLGKAVRLQMLNLNSTPLELLPDSICSLSSLENLYLDDTRISTLPDAFGELQKLNWLSLRGSRVRSLPETFNKLSNLWSIHMTVTTSLKDGTHSGSEARSTIPHSHEDLGCLLNVELDFSGEEEVELGFSREVEEVEETPAIISSTFLSPRLPLHRIYRLRISGEKVGESLLPALFESLKKIISLRYLTLELFNEVEALPAELGTITGLGRLHIKSCQKLRELPDLSGLLNLIALRLENLPRLRTLPDALWTRPPQFDLTVLNCVSLQCMPRSFGHTFAEDKDFSAACPDSNPAVCVDGRDNVVIDTDSWRLLRCLLECCPSRCHFIYFRLKDEQMEMVKKMAVEWEGERFFKLKVSSRVLRQLSKHCPAGDAGPHGSFTPSIAWPPLKQSSFPKVYLQDGLDVPVPSVRVRIMDEEDRDGESSDQDSDSASDAEGSEEGVGPRKRRRLLDNIEEAAELFESGSEQSDDEERSRKTIE